MTVWYSSDLGWSPGQEVSDEFASLLQNGFRAGDTLVLEDTFGISGNYYRLPTNFTLTAESGGGFDVATSADSSAPVFLASDGVTIDNMTFRAVTAPTTSTSSTNPVAGEDYHRARMISVDGDGVTVENSLFSGNVRMHVDVQEGDDFNSAGTRYEGGFYQLRLTGSADDAVIERSHFLNSLGDGIKTESVGKYGPQRAQVIDSFFRGNNRDGIDIAGGFKDGRVVNSVFLDNGVSGIDIKSGYDDASDLSPYKLNTGIDISGSEFIDSPNGIVVTVINRQGVLTEANADAIPNDISVTDSNFENTGGRETRAFLIKDGYDITWSGLTLRGDMKELRLMNEEAPSSPSGTNIGGESSTGVIRNLSASELWSYNVGPETSGENTSGSTVRTEDSISLAGTTTEETTDVTDDGTVDGSGTTDDSTKTFFSTESKVLFQVDGATEFDGSKGSVIEVAPNDALRVDAATISFGFNADTTSGRMGLVSRDAYGTSVNEGHFTSYLRDGTLHVRFQEDTASKSFKVTGIEAGTDYSVAASFGDGKVTVWLDGTVVGEAQFDTGWTDNEEYLQIGANGWASKSGEAGFTDAFDGTISDVVISDGYATTGTQSESETEPSAESLPSPTIDIDPVTGDNELNETETQSVEITGTTANVADAETVTVSLASGTTSVLGKATVSGGVWTLGEADLSGLSGGDHSLSASVSTDGGTASVTEQFVVLEPDHSVEVEQFFARDGEMVFDGSSDSVMEVPPADSLLVDAATISFDFNADDTSGRKGLVSKDGYGTSVNDGHFTSYIRDGTLHLRFQEESASKNFKVTGIEAGTDYSVAASFGDGKVAVWLDGALVGEAKFDMDWIENEEYLQIGANGWASKSGEAGFTDAFDGTISDVAIWDADPSTASSISSLGLNSSELFI